MTYDQAQSPRLGQRLAPENPGVRIVTLTDLPEVAYRGQIVYLQDRDYIYLYDGDSWQAVGDNGDARLFVGHTDPALDPDNAIRPGDQWLNRNDNILYVRDETNTSWVAPDVPPDSVGESQLQADAITAKHTLTGPLIQTDADPAAGVKLSNSYGITAYDSSDGSPTFNVDPSTGVVGVLKGHISTGSSTEDRIEIGTPFLGQETIAWWYADNTLRTAFIPAAAPNTLSFFGTLSIFGEITGPGTVPLGTVIMWVAPTLPSDHWLTCDGSTFSTSLYPDLFALLGTNVLPDLRDRVPVGAGTEVSMNSTEGRALGNRKPITHSHYMKDHRHGIPSGGSHNHGGSTSSVSLDPASTTAGGGSLTRLRADPHSHDIAPGGEHAHGGETDPPDDNITSETTTGYYGLRFLIRAE